MHEDVMGEMCAQEARHAAIAQAQWAQLARLEEKLRHEAAVDESRHAAVTKLLQKEIDAIKDGQAMVLQAVTALPRAALSPWRGDAPPPSEAHDSQTGTLKEVAGRLSAHLHPGGSAAATVAPGDQDIRAEMGSISDRITVMMAAVSELGQQCTMTSRIHISQVTALVEDLQRRLAVTISQLASIVHASINMTGRFIEDHGVRLGRLEGQLPMAGEPIRLGGVGSLAPPGEPNNPAGRA